MAKRIALPNVFFRKLRGQNFNDGEHQHDQKNLPFCEPRDIANQIVGRTPQLACCRPPFFTRFSAEAPWMANISDSSIIRFSDDPGMLALTCCCDPAPLCVFCRLRRKRITKGENQQSRGTFDILMVLGCGQ